MVTLALDIGGTRMKLALLQDGKIIKESMVPAYRDDAYQRKTSIRRKPKAAA